MDATSSRADRAGHPSPHAHIRSPLGNQARGASAPRLSARPQDARHHFCQQTLMRPPKLPVDAALKSCRGAQETRRRTASLKLDGPCGYHAPSQGDNLASHRSTYKTAYPPISPTRLHEPTGAAWARYYDNSGARSLNPNNHPPTANNSSQNTRSPHKYTHHHPYTRRTRGGHQRGHSTRTNEPSQPQPIANLRPRRHQEQRTRTRYQQAP